MPHALIFSLMFIFISLLLPGCEDKTAPPLNIEVGQPFPDILLKDIEDNDVAFAQLPKRARVINIWATWCGPCRYELPSLQRLQEKLKNKNIDVIGISVDDDNYAVREFLIEQKIDYKNFLDKDMSIANNVLGVRVFPSTYLVSSDGIIQEIIQGWREWDSPEMLEKIHQLTKK